MKKTNQRISDIPFEEVARLPSPGMAIPGALAFSPDDNWITYLYSPENSLTRQLYCFNPQEGVHSLLVAAGDKGRQEEDVTPEQALRRERQRQLELGITSYVWATVGERLLLPMPDGLYIKDGIGGEYQLLISSGGSSFIDPQFSPDGKWVAYVQDNELYIISSDGGESRQVTSGARDTGISHGKAEYIAQEEMDRSQGFWWSPDSRWLAYEEVDETHIPVYRIMHQGKDLTGENAQEDHHYPFTGQANAIIRLGVIPLEGGETVWMDLGSNPDIYLARVAWLPDGRLSAQIENRQQTELELVRFDPTNGERKTWLHESNTVWINLHDMFRPLKQGGFIWASERSGYRHLYLYNEHGNLDRPLTRGNWMVDAIAGVDEERRMVYFSGTRESPLESHLYVVSLDGGDVRRITSEPGIHSAIIDHACQRFIDTYDALDQPPVICLRSLADGAWLHTINEPKDPRTTELELQPPELVCLKSRDGTPLYGAIYRPPDGCGQAPYPTVVSVYGGPHAQMVKNSWYMTTAMRAQRLRRQGYLVFVLDNRGSARRGQAFEGQIKGKLGSLEVQDQVDGVRWLVRQDLADPHRVGIYGWSYGGYMALMCLARAPETFKVAVSGAPVTHMDGYDTHYTERYMGTPQSNPKGYDESSVLNNVNGIRGHLMIVHGLIDENVHFRHTARLINALIRARITYKLLLFPNERHTPRRIEDRIYLEEAIAVFFNEYL